MMRITSWFPIIRRGRNIFSGTWMWMVAGTPNGGMEESVARQAWDRYIKACAHCRKLNSAPPDGNMWDPPFGDQYEEPTLAPKSRVDLQM